MLVPGIGKKTATRLLMELKSRLSLDLDDPDLGLVAGGAGTGNGTAAPTGAAATRTEVRNALASLGYGADEIRLALARLPAEGTVEDHLRLALREMAATR